MPTDTHPDADRVQIELLRRASGAERVSRLRSQTRLVVDLSRRAIARANPDWSRRQVELRWVELHYGEPIASGLRKYLESRD